MLKVMQNIRTVRGNKIEVKQPINRRAKIGTRKRAGEYQYMADAQLNICPYCFNKMDKYVMDHITPMATGGTDDHDNLIPCCDECNKKKSSHSLLVFLNTRTMTATDKYWKATGNWHNS